MRRELRGEWLAWALLWCALRAVLLLSFADVFGYGEEFEKACAAKAMLDGLPIPHYQLAYHYYEGGGFVVSHLDALAFLLFGASLFAVKLVALALGVLVLWAGWRFCEHLGGRNAARLFALAFVFAPASVQKLSLLALGIHFHALAFVALVLAGTVAVVEARGRDPRTWFLLGLAAGFGLYFSYLLALTLGVAGLALALGLRRELLRRTALFGVLGLAVGALPLAWMAVRVGAKVLDIHGADLVAEEGTNKLATLRDFAASVFTGRSALDLAGLTFLCAAPWLALFALGRAASPRLRLGAWLTLGHLAVFVLAYVASGFTVGRVYHYFLLSRLTPLWWFAVVLAALGAAAAWSARTRWKRALAAVVVAGLACTGALDTLEVARHARAEDETTCSPLANLSTLAGTKGYAYGGYIAKLEPHLAGTKVEQLAVLLRFHEPVDSAAATELLHAGIVTGLLGDVAQPLDELLRQAREAGVQDLRGILLGSGTSLRKLHGRDLAARVNAVESYPPELRAALYEAVGSDGLGQHPTRERLAREVQVGLDLGAPAAYFTGLGRRMYRTRSALAPRRYFELEEGPWMLARGRAEAFASVQPAWVASALLAGYDAAREANELPGRATR